MAPCTPVSPPQAFPFNATSRRVSAPPPAPLRCPHNNKRRSLLALSDAPAKCRRRLSFSEHPPPAEPPELPPALHDLDHADQAVRHAAWRHIARLLRERTPHPRLAHAVLPPVLAVLNTRPHASHTPIVAALLPALLSSLRASEQPGLSAQHSALMCAIMSAVGALARPAPALLALLRVLREEQCARIMPRQAAQRARPLLAAALACLRAPDLRPALWPPLLHLVALVVHACERADVPPHALPLGAREAAAVLHSVDTMASRSVHHTMDALDALKLVLSRRHVLRHFVRADASAVIAEVSSLFADEVPLQHRCVDLLARLSSPTILTASER